MPRQRASEVRRSQARLLGRMIAGAKPAFHPGFITPQLAYLVEDVPQGPRWLHELKFDGYRLQAHKEKGGVRIYTRGGHDWTQRFSHIAGEVQRLPAQNIILDGEIISATEAGLASFTALQADLSRGDQSRMVYYVFDLLFLDGFDLRDAPLVERKRVLAAFLSESKASRIMLSEHFWEGEKLLGESCRIGGEGIVSKRRDAPYRSARARTWLKIKCSLCDVFTIVGFVPQRGDNIAALRLGRSVGQKLEYIGKAGTGFTVEGGAALRRTLDAIATGVPPLGHPIRRPDTIWVEPKLKAHIQYAEITPEPRLRHASFKGLA